MPEYEEVEKQMRVILKQFLIKVTNENPVK